MPVTRQMYANAEVQILDFSPYRVEFWMPKAVPVYRRGGNKDRAAAKFGNPLEFTHSQVSIAQ